MFYHGQQIIDVIMTYKFRKDHVYFASSREEVQEAKGRAEVRFLARQAEIDTNTLLLVTPEKLRLLYEEVMRGQAKCQDDLDAANTIRERQARERRRPFVPLTAPAQEYKTVIQFEYFQRTGKRAVLHSPARLVYNVSRDANMFKINHLEEME